MIPLSRLRSLAQTVAACLVAISVVATATRWWLEADDRTKEKHFRAWQVVTSAQGKRGSGGRIQALEDLNRDGVSLVGVDLSDAWLYEIRLERAQLSHSCLDSAFLVGAKLSGADLSRASLRGTNLASAEVTSASFAEADLSNANLAFASLAGADFTDADLRGAHLSGISGWKDVVSWQLANVANLAASPDAAFLDHVTRRGAVALSRTEEWDQLVKQQRLTRRPRLGIPGALVSRGGQLSPLWYKCR